MSFFELMNAGMSALDLHKADKFIRSLVKGETIKVTLNSGDLLIYLK